MALNEVLLQVQKHWNEHEDLPRPRGGRWWKSAIVWTHLNTRHFGQSSTNKFEYHNYLKRRFQRVFKQGLSIGCGTAAKELNLIGLGLVQRFDLFELSERRIALGRQKAEALKLTERVTFNLGNVFSSDVNEVYDFIYWHASLHHMMDVPAAIKWCKAALKPGGAITINEYTGPSRFQWANEALEIAAEVRAGMPESIKQKLRAAHGTFSPRIRRPAVERMILEDPSEAADSERILASMAEEFENFEFEHTGGWLYQMALNDLYPFISTEEERAWLRTVLTFDAGLARASFSHFSFGMAVKGR